MVVGKEMPIEYWASCLAGWGAVRASGQRLSYLFAPIVTGGETMELVILIVAVWFISLVASIVLGHTLADGWASRSGHDRR